eukprot:scaffold367228_cov41-Attheya_sp.AAC.1
MKRRESEGLATYGWVLSLVILSPVRQWAYQPPSLTVGFNNPIASLKGNVSVEHHDTSAEKQAVLDRGVVS